MVSVTVDRSETVAQSRPESGSFAIDRITPREAEVEPVDLGEEQRVEVERDRPEILPPRSTGMVPTAWSFKVMAIWLSEGISAGEAPPNTESRAAVTTSSLRMPNSTPCRSDVPRICIGPLRPRSCSVRVTCRTPSADGPAGGAAVAEAEAAGDAGTRAVPAGGGGIASEGTGTVRAGVTAGGAGTPGAAGAGVVL